MTAAVKLDTQNLRRPCGHGSLPYHADLGVHTCPICGALHKFETKHVTYYGVRKLLPPELARLADISPDDLATLSPADRGFIACGFPEDDALFQDTTNRSDWQTFAGLLSAAIFAGCLIFSAWVAWL